MAAGHSAKQNQFLQTIVPFLRILTDIIVMLGVYGVIYLIRVIIVPHLLSTPRMITWSLAIRLFPLYTFPWLFFLLLEGIYSDRPPQTMELRHVLKAGTRALLFQALFILLTRTYEVISRFFIITYDLTLPLVLLPLHRMIARGLTNRSLMTRRLILIGESKRIRSFLDSISQTNGWLTEALFPTDDAVELKALPYPILNTYDDLQTFCSHSLHPVDILILSASSLPFPLHRLESLFLHAGGDIYLSPESPTFYSLTSDIEIWKGRPLVHTRNNLARPYNRLIKRLADLLLTLILLIPALPLALIVAICIRLESRGPVIFAHARIGHRGSVFQCLKFRTMYVDASARLTRYLEQHPEAKKEWETFRKIRGHDPRITRVGRLLRRLSLDELPQLWNVLKGDMSLVGPRPYAVDERHRLGSYLELITHVRPGMTGLWQVSGRSERTFTERIELDLFYIRNWDFWLDAEILFRTIWTVISGRGAY